MRTLLFSVLVCSLFLVGCLQSERVVAPNPGALQQNAGNSSITPSAQPTEEAEATALTQNFGVYEFLGATHTSGLQHPVAHDVYMYRVKEEYRTNIRSDYCDAFVLFSDTNYSWHIRKDLPDDKIVLKFGQKVVAYPDRYYWYSVNNSVSLECIKSDELLRAFLNKFPSKIS